MNSLHTPSRTEGRKDRRQARALWALLLGGALLWLGPSAGPPALADHDVYNACDPRFNEAIADADAQKVCLEKALQERITAQCGDLEGDALLECENRQDPYAYDPPSSATHIPKTKWGSIGARGPIITSGGLGEQANVIPFAVYPGEQIDAGAGRYTTGYYTPCNKFVRVEEPMQLAMPARDFPAQEALWALQAANGRPPALGSKAKFEGDTAYEDCRTLEGCHQDPEGDENGFCDPAQTGSCRGDRCCHPAGHREDGPSGTYESFGPGSIAPVMEAACLAELAKSSASCGLNPFRTFKLSDDVAEGLGIEYPPDVVPSLLSTACTMVLQGADATTPGSWAILPGALTLKSAYASVIPSYAAADWCNPNHESYRQGAGTNELFASLLQFRRCDPRKAFRESGTPDKHYLWAPIGGAEIEVLAGGRYYYESSRSNGAYSITYYAMKADAVPSSDGFDPVQAINQHVTIAFEQVAPRSPAKYIRYSRNLQGASTFENYPVDIMPLTGGAVLQNPDGRIVRMVEYDFDGPISNLDDSVTRYDYTPMVEPDPDDPDAPPARSALSDQGLLSQISGPDLRDSDLYVFRASDGALVGSRFGFKSYELFGTRTTGGAPGDGCAVGDAFGPEAMTPLLEGQTGPPVGASVCYSALIRGPGELTSPWHWDGSKWVGANGLDTRGTYQSQYTSGGLRDLQCRDNQADQSGAPSQDDVFGDGNCAVVQTVELEYPFHNDFARQFIQQGDQVKVVVVNRATGYIGTSGNPDTPTRVTSGPTGLPDIQVGGIVMRPPNLTIRVLRQPSQHAGLQHVGSEGATLTTDDVVMIETLWFDHKDRPLPGGLRGYTGRIVRSEEGKTLPEGFTGPQNDVAVFDIRPGRHIQAVRLGGDDSNGDTRRDAVTNYYIHVDGEARENRAVFAVGARASGPSFSTTDKLYCYFCSGGDSNPDHDSPPNTCCHPVTLDNPGAGAGALQYRPADYVPFKVPVYDAVKTAAIRDQRQKQGLPPLQDPAYSFYYRPEMHFRQIDLDTLGMKLEVTQDGNTVDLLQPGHAPVDLAEQFSADLYFELFERSEQQLETFDPRKEIVADIGTDRGTGGATGIDDQYGYHWLNTSLSADTPEDLLSVRLALDGDEGNVLWQYDFKWLHIHAKDPAKDTLSAGTSLELVARIGGVPADEVHVEWEIEEPILGVFLRKNSNDQTKVELIAYSNIDEGSVKVRATLWLGNEPTDLTDAVLVNCGCQCAERDEDPTRLCAAAGNSGAVLGSVDFAMSLGKAPQGGGAGTLYVKADAIDYSYLLSRHSLQLSTLSKDSTLAVTDAGGLRQVRLANGLADIEPGANDEGYTVRLYEEAQLEALKQAGILEPDPVSRLFEVPATAPLAEMVVGANGDGGLRVVQRRPYGPDETVDYAQEQDGSWTLARTPVVDDPLTLETRLQETTDGATVTRYVATQKAGTDRVVHTVYRRDVYQLAESANGIPMEHLLSSHTGPSAKFDTEGSNWVGFVRQYEAHPKPSIGGQYLQLVEETDTDGVSVSYMYDDEGRRKEEDRPYAHTREVTTTSFVPHAGDVCEQGSIACAGLVDLPRTVTRTISNTVVGQMHTTYKMLGDQKQVVQEQCTASSCIPGDPGNLVTTTLYYAEDDGRFGGRAPLSSGRVQHVTQADGARDEYLYEYGYYTDGWFTPGDGIATRTTVTHIADGQQGLAAGQTTREVSVTDDYGNAVVDERFALPVVGDWRLLDRTIRQYNTDGRMVRADYADGSYETAEWGCCAQNGGVDRAGRLLTITQDDEGRVKTRTRDDITTTYRYDHEGRVVSTVRAHAVEGLSLSSSSRYDELGRLDDSTSEDGLLTDYHYPSPRITTVTRPGGATETTTTFEDGRTQHVAGTAVVERHYTYEVGGQLGVTTTRVTTGSNPNGPVYELSEQDAAGRTVRVERPGPLGSEETTSEYDAAGRLTKTTTVGQAPTIYEYEHGVQVRTGIDLGGAADALDDGDRYTSQSSEIVVAADDTWQVTEQSVNTPGGLVVVGTTRSRLSVRPGVVSESYSVDIHDNETHSFTLRSGPQTTRTVQTPTGTTTTVAEDGRVASVTDATGATTSYDYDGLSRRTHVTQARHGGAATVTSYDPNTGRLSSVTDPAGNTTRFEYDETTGRKTAEFNADDKATRFSYSDRGQLIASWGHVPYPVSYTYDSFGRRKTMTTYRGGEDFTGETFPNGASGDTTTWVYDGDPGDPDGTDNGTGLLVAKLDAAGKGASYTYETGGRLKTRTWARGGATTYGYDPQTGEMLTVDYSDATPDIVYTYDSLGRQRTVTDAVGTRTFAYDPDTLQLVSETIDGVDDAHDVALHRKYETGAEPNGVPGRAAGLFLDDSSQYNVTYAYSGVGRFEKLHFDVGDGVSNTVDQATYSYKANSDLLSGMTTLSGQTTTYQYEPTRDVRTQVKNVFGATTVSQYDYRYDELGRRRDAVASGTAFGGQGNEELNLWGYNDRNELTASNRHEGINPDAPGAEDTDEKRSYLYDPIGNRKTALGQDGLDSINYNTNDLNQYANIDGVTHSYDLDGNMTGDGSGNVLTYNGENRLVGFDDGQGTVASYEYDYIGRRVKKTVGAETTTFVWDGWNLVREVRDDGVGGVSTKHNVWGLDVGRSLAKAGGIGGLLAVVSDGGSAQLFAYDGNGNVGQVVSAGVVEAAYEYDAFGNVVSQSGVSAEENVWRFSTKAVDAETGYSYYGFRYYDPAMGRWLNKDPLGEQGGMNVYGFVGNQATLLIDPVGLAWYDGDNIAGFAAGVGDTLTFGATSWIRQQAGVDDLVRYDSTAYLAGMTTEIVVETTITLGGSLLRRRAAQYTGQAARRILEGSGRTQFRRAIGRLRGGIVHHVNPIRQTRFPLPFVSSARGFWNMKWLPNRAAHTAAHRYLRKLDQIDYVRTWSQPIRVAAAELYRRLNLAAQEEELRQADSSSSDGSSRVCLAIPEIEIRQTVDILVTATFNQSSTGRE